MTLRRHEAELAARYLHLSRVLGLQVQLVSLLALQHLNTLACALLEPAMKGGVRLAALYGMTSMLHPGVLCLDSALRYSAQPALSAVKACCAACAWVWALAEPQACNLHVVYCTTSSCIFQRTMHRPTVQAPP